MLIDDRFVVADMEYKLQTALKIQNQCGCGSYLVQNRLRLLPAFIQASYDQDRDVANIVAQFCVGLHQRHMEGKPLR